VQQSIAVFLLAAVTLFTAAPARAASFIFAIDGTRSYLSQSGSGFQQTDTAGNPTLPLQFRTPQNAALNNGPFIPAGSLNSPLSGNLLVTLAPGSIQFSALGGNQMVLTTTGNYQPGEDGAGNLPPVSPGAQAGNFGAKVIAIGETSRDYGWAFDSPVSLDPTLSHPAALSTDGLGNFNAHGLELLQNQGFEDILRSIANPSKTNLAGLIIPVDGNNGPSGIGGFQANGSVVGNIDPITHHLVIPINEVLYSPVIFSQTLLGYEVLALNGRIVADQSIMVPEPSSLTLLTFASLTFGCARFVRRRRGT
jgi:hypothetical protein